MEICYVFEVYLCFTSHIFYHIQLIDSLHWTTEHYPEPPLLASGCLLDIVEDVVSCQYFNTAYQALAKTQNTYQHQVIWIITLILMNKWNHVKI